MYRLKEKVNFKLKTRRVTYICETCGVEKTVVLDYKTPFSTETHCTSCGTVLLNFVGLLVSACIRKRYNRYIAIDSTCFGAGRR